MNEQAGLSLRPARPADLAQVMEIEQCSFVDPWPRRALLGELQPDRIRKPWVAERNGHIVGYLMAWRVVYQLHVLNLAVRPQERRLGTGSRLLTEALHDAAAHGLREAALEVRQSNQSAQKFYRYHGFVATGRRRGYYADTGEDAIVMTRPLARNTHE